jgi:hypothetical protein
MKRLVVWAVERSVEAPLAILAVAVVASVLPSPHPLKGGAQLFLGILGVPIFYGTSGYFVTATVIPLLFRGLKARTYRLVLVAAFVAHALLFTAPFALGHKADISYVIFAMVPVGAGIVAVAALAGDWVLARLGPGPEAA